jgi:hypothetical protein
MATLKTIESLVNFEFFLVFQTKIIVSNEVWMGNVQQKYIVENFILLWNISKKMIIIISICNWRT